MEDRRSTAYLTSSVWGTSALMTVRSSPTLSVPSSRPRRADRSLMIVPTRSSGTITDTVSSGSSIVTIGPARGLAQRQPAGHLEGHVGGVDAVGLAVGQGHAEVDDRVAVADAALHLGAHALLDRGDEVAGYGAPDDLVDELEPAALGEGLDLDVAHGVLAVAAGLLDVPAVALRGAAERLAQRHHERHLLDVHRVALGQPLDDDVGVGLAHAPDHQLVGLAVVLDTDARDPPRRAGRGPARACPRRPCWRRRSRPAAAARASTRAAAPAGRRLPTGCRRSRPG